MQADLISTKAAADKLGIHYLKLLNRGALLNLKPKTINRTFFWTFEQLDLILSYNNTRKIRKDAKSNFSKDKIKIIELFMASNNNSYFEIQKQVNCSTSYIGRTITEYLKTKCLIVESKINL
jgi:hypothetical protein